MTSSRALLNRVLRAADTRTMGRLGRSSRRAARLVVVAALAVGAAGCVVPPPPAGACEAPAGSSPTAVAVMGPCARVSASEIVAWFLAQTRPTYRASVPIAELAQLYVEEGMAEGVRGDIAFVQSIIETGWFNFPGGSVLPEYNNFAGLGATDSDPAPAQFSEARAGVRAQIQHLRAYADATAATCTVPPLANPCVDPRFALVSPKGKAPTWNQFGNGVWASSSTYANQILTRYTQLLGSIGKNLA